MSDVNRELPRLTITEAYETTDANGNPVSPEAHRAKVRIGIEDIDDPLESFALLAAYFSGQQNRKMEDKLEEYKEKTDDYKRVLNTSQKAHTYLADAKAQEGKDKEWPKCDNAFKNDMNWVLTGSGKNFNDISDDKKLDDNEAQACVDAISQKKDMTSTELQAITTEMDMAVKDAGEAEQMAANAVKKLTDLISTLGKNAGG